MGDPRVVTFDPVGARPSDGPEPGAIALQAAILKQFSPAKNLGIYNPRDVCGNPWPKIKCSLSTHAEGRAGDSGFPVIRPEGHPVGTILATTLVMHHEALGIQEVIWAGKCWTSKTEKWKPYKGRSDHFDHVHWTLTRASADALTRPQAERILQGDEDMAWTDVDSANLKRAADALESINHQVAGKGTRVARLVIACEAVRDKIAPKG